MDKLPFLQLSVHGLVDALLRAGDIDSRVYNQETMQMGTLLHASYQERQGKEYLSEVPLSGRVETSLGTIALQGRADGIILGGPFPIVDEIKSTVMRLDEFYLQQKEWHLGQALCYAYLYLLDKSEERIGVQLTYLSQIHSEEKDTHSFVFTKEQVEEKVKGYVEAYLAWRSEHFSHLESRDSSAKSLPFPFPNFRAGQKKLAQCVRGLAKKGGLFFVEAPTGIGKTMSVLYPSALSFEQGRIDRIFYLTAKNSGAEAAEQAASLLREKGLDARVSSLLAKEKMCFCPGHACNPDDCPFAKGYYDKVKEAVKKAVESSSSFYPSFVLDIAREFGICPFEFQLDLSLESDIIIGDYNYFFDPFTHLERYFDPTVDASKDLLLVDEAHNLVERSRAMYSASISSYEASSARKALKGDAYKSIRRAIKKAEAIFPALCDEEFSDLKESPEELEKAFESLKRAESKELKEQKGALPAEYRDFRRDFGRYIRILKDFCDSTYSLFASRDESSVTLHLNCLDPANFLRESFSKVRGAVLFSATLSPISYYLRSLSGRDDDPYLLLPSPFDKKNLKVLIAPKVSTRYKVRARFYQDVAAYLDEFAAAKKGNYFFYFPSYAYLDAVRPFLHLDGCKVLVQGKGMLAEERRDFLAAFTPNPKETTVGLLVLGGAFGEAIDLVDDRLIGVAVVGVGLPQVGFENDLLRAYYDEAGSDGFAIAYRYPGFNKVTQAVGRLIRSESDRGAVLFLDERYLQEDYSPLMERLWPDYSLLLSPQEVKEELSSFYFQAQD